MLVAVTFALGIKAPEESCTTPVMDPWSVCAKQDVASSRISSAKPVTRKVELVRFEVAGLKSILAIVLCLQALGAGTRRSASVTLHSCVLTYVSKENRVRYR